MADKFSDALGFPLPDEVRKAIEEILKEQGAKEELMRIGILKVIHGKGGEIKLAVEQSLGDIKIRRGMEGDEKSLGELLESLQEEGKVWRKMMVLKGKEKDWIYNLTKDDRVHNSEHPGKWLFFAFDGEKLVGHVNGIAWDRAPSEYKQHVENIKAKYNLVGERVGHVGIAVHKDCRLRGIGEMLMQRAVQEAKELGVTVLTININTENTPMIRLAEKFGFKEHMRERKDEKESIIMKLDLQ